MKSALVHSGITPTWGNALEIQNLSKRFGNSLALNRVSLSVRTGEVHGLLGSNGSGKSTLIKILAGFFSPEPGAQIRLYDQELNLPNIGQMAHRFGLAFVHQNLGLIPSLTVTENLFLGSIATQQNWNIEWRELHRSAREIFVQYNLTLDPTAMVSALSPVEQAMLAIIRAHRELLATENDHPGILVLDEPTPFLPRKSVDQLFELIRTCKDKGSSILFVSHDIDEVREITDRATVLRDGELIGTFDTHDTDHETFVAQIIGRDLDKFAGSNVTRDTRKTLVKVTDLEAHNFGPISFDIAEGEILGMTGLIGSGFSSVPSILFGSGNSYSGLFKFDGTNIDLTKLCPRQAQELAIAYLPADRLGSAGIGSISVADNIALPVYPEIRGRWGLTDKQVLDHGRLMGEEAGVKPNDPILPLASLSGGNAQKALLKKWLQISPRLLLLDEPTQGVDVGARQQIWDALVNSAANGASILIASTDYEQLACLCHRVLIFAKGRIYGELTAPDLSKNAIAESCYQSMVASS